MSKEHNEDIISQKSQVFEGNFKVDLNTACNVGHGVVKFDDFNEDQLMLKFNRSTAIPTVFIPSSGTGSRMFHFLFEWLENGIDTPEIDEFFKIIGSLALCDGSFDINDKKSIISALLDDDKMNLANLPKGLFPFHKYENGVRTAFQEHVIQAKELFPNALKIHFTIQKEFESDIKSNIALTSGAKSCSFSYQSDESSAYCFGMNKELIEENGVPLKRPSGHGALLENLNKLDSELVLVKNIDNVQHGSKSNMSIDVWKKTIGILLSFRNDLLNLSANFSQDNLIKMNERYQFLSDEEIQDFDSSKLELILSRPTRVCGMVVNEGEPGGGPFWINDNGHITKQIIEKIQISDASDQKSIVEGSSHFNPVFMALSKTDAAGKILDLNDFTDDSKYFVVKKSHKGESILYRELPGLWNGSMSNWNTIFVEIPTDVFSPVKTILDLAKEPHTS